MLRVIMIEDDLVLTDTIAEHFAPVWGWDLRVATSTEQARQIMHGFRPQVLVTDILLGNESALSFAAEIAEKHPSVGLIVCSGNFTGVEFPPALQGALRLEKIYDPEDLQNLVEQAAGQASNKVP